MHPLPDDACPYRRPFPPGFADCETFDSQMFVALTSTNRPLPAVRTCRFLETGQTERGRFYARCALGTPADRASWLARLDPKRVEGLRRIRRLLSSATAPLTERLWEIKGRQITAYEQRDEAAQARAAADLEAACAEFMSVVEAFLGESESQLAELGIARESMRELLGALLDQMVVQRSADSGRFSAPPEVLARFPEEVRAIFTPYEPI